GRFEAILAVTGQGSDVDDALVGDLEAVGAQAAWSGSPLPQLLVLLRISRDLVVQTAVELAEGRGRSSGLALSLLLTRILPAMDRLTDSLARGYWDALLGREEEGLARYRGVVEQASDGVFEADLDGRISWANAGFALIVGRRLATLDGADLADVLAPVEGAGALDPLLDEDGDGSLVSLEITRADGIRRSLTVQSLRRRVDDEVVGFQGIVRDDTVQQEFEADREAFFTLVRNEIRAPLATIVGLASTLESHAAELAADQMARTGRSIRLQAEGLSRLADDLDDVGQLHARSLRVSIRPVEMALVVEGSLASVENAGAVQVDVEPGITVLADPRRLEQVIANLVDNALIHGAPPVTVDAEQRHDEVYRTVRDAGPGVPA
ncbi:MAG: ATP-binding protein, partial [Acidimicrobiales bacterium]